MGIPIDLTMKHKKVLIIGGGKVGLRKAEKLLQYGAKVRIVSVEHDDGFDVLPQCELIKDVYKVKYLSGTDLVIAATSDQRINTEIYDDAKGLGILCQTSDAGSPSDFSFMATAEKSGLTVAVGTEGQSPSFAKDLVQRLFNSLTEEDFRRLDLMGQIRIRLLNLNNTPAAKKALIKECDNMSVLELTQLLNTLNN